MSQYLVAIHLPDNFDPSAESRRVGYAQRTRIPSLSLTLLWARLGPEQVPLSGQRLLPSLAGAKWVSIPSLRPGSMFICGQQSPAANGVRSVRTDGGFGSTWRLKT